MKILNTFEPRDRKTIYAIQDFEAYLCKKQKVLKNYIPLNCRKKHASESEIVSIEQFEV